MPSTKQDNKDSTIKITFVGLESHFNKIDWASQDQLTSASKATGKKNLNKIKNRIKYIMAKGISISDLFNYRLDPDVGIFAPGYTTKAGPLLRSNLHLSRTLQRTLERDIKR